MSKKEKLKARLYTYPKDFTWEELITVLSSYGYNELKKGKTGGSRRKFKDERDHIIILHEPHPKNIIKEYVIEQVVLQLQLKDEEAKAKEGKENAAKGKKK